MSTKKMMVFAAVAAGAMLQSHAIDNPVTADYTLNADETVDGVLTVETGVTVDLNGHKLTVKGLAGDGTITQAYRLDTTVPVPEFVATDAIFWLDASDSSTITLDGANVNTWQSKVGNRTASKNGTAPVYDDTTYGIPTVDFGATGSGKDMSYANMTNIRMVFWVIKIEKNVNAFFLGGANYHFHRAENTAAYASGHFQQQGMWNGTDELVPSLDIPNPDRFHVVCAKMSKDCASNSLTKDRNINGRHGGRQLSELICFSRYLTDEERVAVTEYLQRKWGVAGGELHIDVDEDETAVNGTVALTGGLKLVKEGKGAFTASKASQSYFGGTTVEEGSLTFGTETHPLGLGDASQYVTVKTNATLHSNDKARTTTCCYNFYLGGTLNLTSTAAPYNTGREPFGTRLTLLGDAHLTGSNITLGSFNKKVTIRPNGHTLYYDAVYSYSRNLTTEGPGLIVYTSGTTEVNSGVNYISSGLSFTGSSYTHLGDQGYSTGYFKYDASKWVTHRTAGQVIVYDRYVAGPIRPWLTLQNGATLDLSEVTGAFNLAGVNPVTGGANRSFTAGGKVTLLSANASYTIDIGAREVAVGDKLVEWDAMPAESVEFAFVATGAAQTLEERELALAVRDDGLYVKSTKVPYARWDLNAETPGWRFYYPNGVEAVDWRDGVTSEVEVRFASYDEYVAAKAQHVNPAAYVLMGTFVVPEELDELDLSECFDRFAEDATLDLRGKRVTVLKLSGFGTVTDTTADAEHPSELHVVVPEDARMENSVVAITGNIRLVKDGLGEFVASKINQSYTGGTVVDGGKITLGTSTHPLGQGSGSCLVTVNTNATLDVGNKANTSTCVYSYKLAGTMHIAGEGGWGYNSGKGIFASLELIGDSHVTGSNFWFGRTSGTMALVMNGHTLYFDDCGYFYLRNIATSGGGTIMFSSGSPELNAADNFSTVDVVFTADTRAHLGDQGFSVGGFKYDSANWVTHRTANQVIVVGRYVAGTMRPWMTMRTGSTLDLSEVQGTWDSAGVAPVAGGANRNFTTPGLVSFAADAQIDVVVGDRQDVLSIAHSDNPYLVTWETQPAAAFTLEEAMSKKGFKLVMEDAGLRLVYTGGTTLFLR